MKNFINNQAFTDSVTSLDGADTILVRQTANSKKNTEISYSNFVSATNTFYKVLGTTTASADNAKYTHTNNRLTNDASIRRKYLIHCSLSFNSGNNHVCKFGFYDSVLSAIRTPSRTKGTANGSGRADSVSFSCVVSHIQGDYLEIHCANNTSAQNITVSDMNFLITEIK